MDTTKKESTEKPLRIKKLPTRSLNLDNLTEVEQKLVGIFDRFKNERLKLGLTQQQFGEMFDMNGNAVAQIENRYNLPTLFQLMKMKDKLGFTWEYMLEGIEDDPNKSDVVQELKNEIEKQKTIISYLESKIK
jgi:transcriptional regulator with XRE-family HTH domain